MQEFTFEGKNKTKNEKEKIEWLRLWCEDTNDHTLPRIALIGDSITAQGHEFVKRELKGVANVDYLATSYSIASSAYKGMIEKFIEDSDYALICYNYGLHGFSVDNNEYENVYREMIKKFLKNSKVVISLTTMVHDKENLNKEDETTACIVRERNERAIAIANEFGLIVDDAYTVSMDLGKAGKEEDGVHFNQYGKEKLAINKANAIKRALSI